jgi:hypothetical protein
MSTIVVFVVIITSSVIAWHNFLFLLLHYNIGITYQNNQKTSKFF